MSVNLDRQRSNIAINTKSPRPNIELFFPHSTLFDSLPWKRTWRERLLQLLGLVRIGDAKRVQILPAPDLELGDVAGLLDFHRCVVGRGRATIAEIREQIHTKLSVRGSSSGS